MQRSADTAPLSEAAFRASDDIGAAPAARPHLPGLDGLRGTAILAVVICHYSALLPAAAHGIAGVLELGWAGVDLFFVISGFLITGILFDAKGSAHPFRNFYARRVLRIFPLYYGFLAALGVVLWAARHGPWKAGESIDPLRAAQPWLWGYAANYWIGARAHWSTWAETVIPLWSLSVEEQFYIVWPLAVLTLGRRSLIGLCLTLMLGALALRLALTAHGVDWFCLYTWTPTRADSLAAGGLVALLVRGRAADRLVRGGSIWAAALAGLLTVIVSRGFDPIHHPWLRDVLYTSLAVLFASLLFWSTDDRSLGGVPKRFYELPWLRAAGRYSYGVYILHLPLMYLTRAALAHWGRYQGQSWTAAIALIGVNVVLVSTLALLSFHLFEQRFLNLKRRFPANGATPNLAAPGKV